MKTICKTIGVVAFAILFLQTVYGNAIEVMAAESGGDPTALLLIEQGEQLIKDGNQMEGALASFDLAITVDPAFSRAYFQASAVAAQLGNYDKAISYLTTLGKRNPAHLEIQRLVADLEAKKNRSDPIRVSSSGFREFGIAALIGLVFSFFIAGYQLGDTAPHDTALQVQKPYLIYPLLKTLMQGTQRGLVTVHERRHRSLEWQTPMLYAPQ